jgi:protein-S-isoprenylcysteine O-methyltransferase Ste14
VGRLLCFLYGLISYAISLAVFAYLAGFIANVFVPRSIDAAGGAAAPLGVALLVNLGLLLLFGVQHSVMARPTFKKFWTRLVPEPIERSTYMLFTNAAMFALFLLWQPIDLTVWNVANPAARTSMWALYIAGWGAVLFATFLLNHFDLFGLRQVWLHLRGRQYTHLTFKTPLLYSWIRHPLYVGWMIVFWATPTMTLGHALFALALTAYMLIAIRFEERNLVEFHGPAYESYRRQTPMLIPRLRRTPAPPLPDAAIALNLDSQH